MLRSSLFYYTPYHYASVRAKLVSGPALWQALYVNDGFLYANDGSFYLKSKFRRNSSL